MPTGYASKATIIGTAGTSIETFKDTILANYATPASGTPPPSNQSVIDALTKQFSKDYMSWKCSTFDITYVGSIAPTPNGILDDTEWTFGSGQDVCRTRLMSSPHNFKFQELGHFDWTDDNDCTLTSTPCIYVYGPPAQCVSNILQMTRWRFCIENGRLRQYYYSTDNLT
jgi:hypothetical protein